MAALVFFALWFAASLRSVLARRYGTVETPGNDMPSADATGLAAFPATALHQVESAGKARMAPAAQPVDAFVFASFLRHDIEGAAHYLVVLYFDPPG